MIFSVNFFRNVLIITALYIFLKYYVPFIPTRKIIEIGFQEQQEKKVFFLSFIIKENFIDKRKSIHDIVFLRQGDGLYVKKF